MTNSYTNRLIHEKSPYLQQHAHNPVDWYPWGQEAFDKAKQEDKPIFLSIGYATCHWCHVMGKETFENLEVAKVLNETFVNIKVDREEHPEVDGIYMEFAQALMSSAGGWPLNVVLTPDLKPFFAVTYLPPTSQRGLIGIDQFAKQIHTLWHSDERVNLIAQADKIVQLFAKSLKTSGEDLPSETHLESSIQVLFDIADPVYGGIKGEPKFPLSYQMDFLLQYAKAKNESRALYYVELTCDYMSWGGIYDQLGGGFARYAIDEKWHIPHFEKMLCDNAIISQGYLQAWKYTKKQKFSKIVKETMDYVLREMTHPDGGFYSAQDADCEGSEGRYYSWTLSEITSSLPEKEAQLIAQYYGITPRGNFEGRNVLYVQMQPQETAQLIGMSEQDFAKKLSEIRAILLKKRGERPAPFKDDKIITSWNGLMIDAMTKAGEALNQDLYRKAALKAAEFIQKNLWKEGKLLRRYREGEARFTAGLDDYAFMLKAALTLFEAGAGTSWLKWAMALSEVLELEFKAKEGAFYQTKSATDLLIRKCEFYDGAEPSGNAVHAENLMRLYQITQTEKYIRQAEDILKASKSFIESFPPGSCYHLMNVQRYINKNAPLVVVALDEKRSFESEVKQAFFSHFCPHASIIWKQENDSDLRKLIPFIEDQKTIDGQTAVYICRQDHCEPPLIQIEAIIKAIANL